MKQQYYDTCKVQGYIITVAESEGRITDLNFGTYAPAGAVKERTDCLQQAFSQLEEYFAGERKVFTLPLAPEGTPFQKKVWQALCTIPYGETRCYQEIAVLSGNAKASRAVGMANNKNPISIFIPCHRVIGKNGKLVGYGGGLDKKEALLKLEKTKEK